MMHFMSQKHQMHYYLKTSVNKQAKCVPLSRLMLKNIPSPQAYRYQVSLQTKQALYSQQQLLKQDLKSTNVY